MQVNRALMGMGDFDPTSCMFGVSADGTQCKSATEAGVVIPSTTTNSTGVTCDAYYTALMGQCAYVDNNLNIVTPGTLAAGSTLPAAIANQALTRPTTGAPVASTAGTIAGMSPTTLLLVGAGVLAIVMVMNQR